MAKNPAKQTWETRYLQDDDYMNWTDREWGNRANETRPNPRLDGHTREVVGKAFGTSQLPRKCSGNLLCSTRGPYRHIHNAINIKQAKCCSGWDNGQMGFNTSGQPKNDYCGFAWSGAANRMTPDELYPPAMRTGIEMRLEGLDGPFPDITGQGNALEPTPEQLEIGGGEGVHIIPNGPIFVDLTLNNKIDSLDNILEALRYSYNQEENELPEGQRRLITPDSYHACTNLNTILNNFINAHRDNDQQLELLNQRLNRIYVRFYDRVLLGGSDRYRIMRRLMREVIRLCRQLSTEPQ